MALVNSQQWATYVDMDDVKEWLQFPTNASVSRDAALQRIIDMACEWVQNEINRPVAATQWTERHDGWSGEYILLNQYPILEVISCLEFQSSGGSLSLSESTPENPIDGFQVNYLTGQLMRTFQGYSWPRPWFPGSRNIEVTYVAGYNPIPPVLWMATVELIKHWWVNAQQASVSLHVDDYAPSQTEQGLWQGVPYRIIDLLAPYRRVVIG
jgi:hypothetical protein